MHRHAAGDPAGATILTTAHDIRRITVAYSSNCYIQTDDGEYQDYPDATWSTDLPPCWTRYKAWLDHEQAARRQMLRFLHEHCPETRELTEWPVLWAYIDPDLARDPHTVHFTHPTQTTTEHPPSATAAA